MQFNRIHPSIDRVFVTRASHILNKLAVELGVRETNNFIGSGMGGNNFQLLVLMSVNHYLSAKPNRKIYYDAKRKRLIWGAGWMTAAKMIDIRRKLNKVFNKISESEKYMAIIFRDLAGSNNLRVTLEEYKDHFPQLTACLNCKTYSFNSSISDLEKLLLAFVMCQDLAHELDTTGNKRRIPYIGSALYDFPAEIILLAVRRYIQIERLIQFDMDEDPIFLKAIEKVNSLAW